MLYGVDTTNAAGVFNFYSKQGDRSMKRNFGINSIALSSERKSPAKNQADMLAHFKSTVLEKLNRELHQVNQPESLQFKGDDPADLGQSGKKNLWQVVEQFK